MVQWLGLCASTAGGLGSIPSPGTKILHAIRQGKKKNYIKGYTQKNNVNKNGILKKYSSNLQLGKKRKTEK